jgi:hypothetical protein
MESRFEVACLNQIIDVMGIHFRVCFRRKGFFRTLDGFDRSGRIFRSASVPQGHAGSQAAEGAANHQSRLNNELSAATAGRYSGGREDLSFDRD